MHTVVHTFVGKQPYDNRYGDGLIHIMKTKSYFLLIGIALLMLACSPGFYYKPDPNTIDPNNTFLSSGHTYIVSRTPNAMIILTAIKPSGGQLQLTVGYLNINLNRADARPDSIRVAFEDEGTSTLLQVYTADQYMRKLRRQENFSIMAKAINDGYNNQNAGYSTSTTYTSTVSNNGTFSSGSSTTTTYDANKAYQANARSSQELNQMEGSFNQYNQSLNQILLRPSTLFKGQKLIGTVVVNASPDISSKIYVTVPFGGEEYNFTLIANK